MKNILCLAALACAEVAWTAPPPANSRPFEHLKRQANGTSVSGLQVDLGYEVYEGYHNTTSKLNQWRGIRYAAPPLGNLRWQAPHPPTLNRSSVISAKDYGPVCPQSPNGGSAPPATYGDEDCLVLNVQAPYNADGLPVLVWIHGGGYGQGSSQQDLSYIINENGNNFVGVAIQYRLGAFGFLSSDEVYRNGVVNAGLLDQTFALKWVQTYIHLFGGDPTKVTVSGESAGAGSVMLQTMAYGGTLGTTLFENAFAASPYLPMQYDYAGWVPSQSYYSFASNAGCFGGKAYGYETKGQTIFDCLIGKDSHTLQNASFATSASANYGIWGFLPVTDHVFIQDLPSRQLTEERVNGQRLLIGNNAEEGAPFVSTNITTEADLITWLQLTFPMFTNSDIAKVLLYYPSSNASTPNAPEFATDGFGPATAVNESAVGVGQQQRANDIYAETTFVCPAYWMAEAFSDPPRTSYKYQYSIIPALHGTDVTGYFGPPGAEPFQGPDFQKAFMQIVGNFVTKNDPSISSQLAAGASANSTSASSTNPISSWPPFEIYAPYQINLNQTGGKEISEDVHGPRNTSLYVNPGLKNDFTLVNAYTWEGGRGYRCDFWKSVGPVVPE